MAGHSKWKNIRIKKGRMDALKGKLFTKLSKEIAMAARQGGPDPAANFRLKDAIARARDASMPNANIERLLDRAKGGADADNLEEVVYEGYGPAGVAIIVEATTDNRNRTAAEVKLIFSKNGGSVGEGGCVAWMFERRGMIMVDAPGSEEEALLMAGMEAGALDLELTDDGFQMLTEPTDLHQVAVALEAAGFKTTSVELTMLPKNTVTIGADEAGAVLKLMDLLEEQDDVQNVHSNFDIPAEVLEAIGVGS